MEKRSASNRWELLKLRLMLLRIWFVKNLVTFIKIGIIVLIILMMTGQITENTPVFGAILYPIFRPLIDSIRDVITTRNTNSFMSFASIALSIIVSITMFTIKIQTIAQNDITSKELKMAMVKAGLYFNENGKMVKKVEKAIGADIDGDGKSDNKEPNTSIGLFKSIKNAVSEFITVMKTDISEGSTAKDEISNASKSIGAEDTQEALEEIDNMLITSALDKASAIIDKKFDNAIEEIEKDPEISKEEIEKVKAKGSFINLIRSGLHNTVSGVKSVFVKEKSANKENGDNMEENIIPQEEIPEKEISEAFNVFDVSSDKQKEEKKESVEEKKTTIISEEKKDTTIVSKPKSKTELVRSRYR